MVKEGWKRPDTARVVVLLNKVEIEAIDRMGKEAGMPSRSETVRHLLEQGMKASQREAA